MQTPLVAITGPTGSGKSAIAVKLAQEMGAEILNADSVQMYKEFRIGASQPKEQDKKLVVHHLYEVLEPSLRSDVAEFVRLADKAICDLRDLDVCPMLVGGSGLYLQTLIHGLADIPEVPSSLVEEAQSEIDKLAMLAKDRQEYFDKVSKFLEVREPKIAASLHPSDTQRIVRALAVFRHTGKSIVDYQLEHANKRLRYSCMVVYLEPQREQLYDSINLRVVQMWNAGLVEEVEQLLSKYGSEAHALGSIGYRHVCNFLSGAWSQEQSIELMQRDTRRFAKRQMTWWRNQPRKLGWKIIDELADELSLGDLIDRYRSFGSKLANSDPNEVEFIGCRSIG